MEMNPFNSIAALEAAARELIAKGKKNTLYGALWCIGGSVATLIGYTSASGGGRYLIFWGAILFGAIQFFNGLSQQSKGKKILSEIGFRHWD